MEDVIDWSKALRLLTKVLKEGHLHFECVETKKSGARFRTWTFQETCALLLQLGALTVAVRSYTISGGGVSEEMIDSLDYGLRCGGAGVCVPIVFF